MNINIADRIELLAVADLNQCNHTVVTDQGTVREADVTANSHKRRVGHVAATIDMYVGTD
ncbi:hypothetical protein D3C77_693990 [compost metagenome]